VPDTPAAEPFDLPAAPTFDFNRPLPPEQLFAFQYARLHETVRRYLDGKVSIEELTELSTAIDAEMTNWLRKTLAALGEAAASLADSSPFSAFDLPAVPAFDFEQGEVSE
jgi:hypothetical protein